MPDINAYIMHPESVRKNPDVLDRELSLNDWSAASAQLLAEREGIVLTPEHWQVIEYLQRYYLQHGWQQSTHSLVKQLDSDFQARGGSRYLYQLFPEGPLAQGSRIAGLPMPHHVENQSLGSVQ